MNSVGLSKKEKQLISITIAGLLVCYWFLFDFLRRVEYDTPCYIGGARRLFGLAGGMDCQSRLTKPLVLLFPGLMELLTGVDPWYSFLVQNIVATFVCGFAIYLLLKGVFQHSWLAYWGMVVYLTCQPFAVYSLIVTVNPVGWAFGVLALFLTWKYIEGEHNLLRNSALIGLLVAVGFLFKESAIIGLIFLLSYIAFQPIPFKKMCSGLGAALIGFGVPSLFAFIAIYLWVGDSFVHRVNDVRTVSGLTHYWRLKQLLRMMDVYWFFVPIGLWNCVLALKKNEDSVLVKATIASLVLAFIGLPYYPYCVDRIVFLTFPLFLIVICYSFTGMLNHLRVLVPVAGVLNIVMTYFIYKNQVQGLLVIGYAVFALLFVFILVQSGYLKTLFNWSQH